MANKWSNLAVVRLGLETLAPSLLPVGNPDEEVREDDALGGAESAAWAGNDLP